MKGLAINKRFYFQVVKPLLEKKYSQLKYACGLIGSGSEVLGVDDLTSRDHNWGLRLIIFIEEKDIDKKIEISDYLSEALPREFENIHVNWSDPSVEDGSRTPVPTKGKINHNITFYTVQEYIKMHFKREQIDSLTVEEWLVVSEQKLLEFVSGEIFYDGIGAITSLREKLQYYPPTVKILNLIGEWNAISSEIAFVGRTRMLYDEIGSHIIACRIINHLMKISFILENKYIPYAKWIGFKFYYLTSARELQPLFQQIISANGWEERENGLVECYLYLSQEMQRLGLISTQINEKFYYSRPQKVININDIILDLRKKIGPEIAKKYPWGSINQIIPLSDTIDDKNYLKTLFKELH